MFPCIRTVSIGLIYITVMALKLKKKSLVPCSGRHYAALRPKKKVNVFCLTFL